MSRAASKGVQLARTALSHGILSECSTPLGVTATSRVYSNVPEYWGQPSPYSGGTDFLGTPSNHLDLTKKRPVSPHVFEIDGKSFHYKMPINAISSIVTRATGVALSVGFAGAGLVALTGDLPAAVEGFKASYPLLVYPVRAAVAFPLIYHYLAGVRHMVWDRSSHGLQAAKNSLLETEAVDRSSRLIIGASVVSSIGLALYSY